jgi:hypothetical protein
MNKKTVLTLLGFIIVGAGSIGFLLLSPFAGQKKQEQRRSRIVIPQERGAPDPAFAEQMAYEDSISTKAAMEEGEIIVSIITQDFDGDPAEEQVVVFRDLREIENSIYISFIDYDETAGIYRRIWTAPTAATQPGTISLFTQDLIGDRSACVIVTGMNSRGEHTMTVFRRNPRSEAFSKIAEIRKPNRRGID